MLFLSNRENTGEELVRTGCGEKRYKQKAVVCMNDFFPSQTPLNNSFFFFLLKYISQGLVFSFTFLI